jgi:bacillithiol system protein YtxJ
MPGLPAVPNAERIDIDNDGKNYRIVTKKIFKHSTRCIVSKMALKNFENNFNLENKIQPYFLDLLEYRAISNEVATRFNIQHQSPQIIVIKNGVAVYATSHEDIDVLFLERFVYTIIV